MAGILAHAPYCTVHEKYFFCKGFFQNPLDCIKLAKKDVVLHSTYAEHKIYFCKCMSWKNRPNEGTYHNDKCELTKNELVELREYSSASFVENSTIARVMTELLLTVCCSNWSLLLNTQMVCL